MIGLTDIIPAPYRLAALLGAAVAIFGAGFYTCHQFGKADQVDAARAETKQAIKQGEVSNAVAVRHEAAQVEIRTVYKTIIKEVPKYVTVKDDIDCPVPRGFVSVWNSASAGAVPGSAIGVDGEAGSAGRADVAD